MHRRRVSGEVLHPHTVPGTRAVSAEVHHAWCVHSERYMVSTSFHVDSESFVVDPDLTPNECKVGCRSGMLCVAEQFANCEATLGGL